MSPPPPTDSFQPTSSPQAFSTCLFPGLCIYAYKVIKIIFLRVMSGGWPLRTYPSPNPCSKQVRNWLRQNSGGRATEKAMGCRAPALSPATPADLPHFLQVHFPGLSSHWAGSPAALGWVHPGPGAHRDLWHSLGHQLRRSLLPSPSPIHTHRRAHKHVQH